LLVGTALAVIIPEGMHTMYNAGTVHEHEHEHEEVVGGCEAPLHAYMGPMLVAGFMFQLFIDKFALAGPHAHAHSTVEDGIALGASGSASASASASASGRGDKAWSATIGLVVHAAADGIALGAAVAAAKASLELLVFVAIMLHKAPAAFGLVSYLLGEGLDRRVIRKHLLAFSVAAPALAIATYVTIRMYAASFAAPGDEGSASQGATSPITGLALLFSGGTFLYVATVHVLPDVISPQSGGDRALLVAVCVGTALPVLLSAGHSH
jgi:zinc transporter 9